MNEELLVRRRFLLSQARLYGILDTGYAMPDQFPEITRQMIAGGVNIIQLRAKNFPENEVGVLAKRLQPLFADSGVLFIINDWPEIAREVSADGVHVGQDDLGLSAVREILSADQLIGKSTHSLAQAQAAALEKPDYIGVGPIFPTPTKPDYVPVGLSLISQVKAGVTLPQFCIGGIKRENLAQVLAAGAERVVIVSAILQASNRIAYCREIRAALGPGNLWA